MYMINIVFLMERVDSYCYFVFIVFMKFWGDLNMNYFIIFLFNNRELIIVFSIY